MNLRENNCSRTLSSSSKISTKRYITTALSLVYRDTSNPNCWMKTTSTIAPFAVRSVEPREVSSSSSCPSYSTWSFRDSTSTSTPAPETNSTISAPSLTFSTSIIISMDTNKFPINSMKTLLNTSWLKKDHPCLRRLLSGTSQLYLRSPYLGPGKLPLSHQLLERSIPNHLLIPRLS